MKGMKSQIMQCVDYGSAAWAFTLELLEISGSIPVTESETAF